MKIYEIVGWCGSERYVEERFTDKEKAYQRCAILNKSRLIGLESLTVESQEVDESKSSTDNNIGFVYEISKTACGSLVARLEAIMYKEDFQELQKQGKAISPLMNNPYVWIDKKSEKRAIETYINKMIKMKS